MSVSQDVLLLPQTLTAQFHHLRDNRKKGLKQVQQTGQRKEVYLLVVALSTGPLNLFQILFTDISGLFYLISGGLKAKHSKKKTNILKNKVFGVMLYVCFWCKIFSLFLPHFAPFALCSSRHQVILDVAAAVLAAALEVELLTQLLAAVS